MANESEPPKLESTIDESDLVYHEQVGRGGSGDVYRATWKSTKFGNIEVAAKKIPLFKGETAEEKFGSEVKYLQTLKHENIITFYGQVVTPEYLVIVTEYAANGSLFDYLSKRTTPLFLKQKLEWAIQAVKAIGYLRDNNILHRDIKSGNFLITSDNILKICNFGISKDLTSTKMTKSEKGTSRWLAPEVFTEQMLSPKADIFAFGIMLWELETGKLPYEGIISARLPLVVGNGQRPEIPANCHPVLKDLMQRCWDGDRDKRPDGEKILEQLQYCLTQIHAVHTIGTTGYIHACHWVSNHHLAVCMEGCVKVYKVTALSSQLAYQLSSDEWEWKYTIGVAVSASLPDSMLVICGGKRYVYEFPCHQATREVKKYKIHSEKMGPQCIAANANTAVIQLSATSRTLVICSLPDFTHQSRVQINVDPRDLSIRTSHLLVMGKNEMVVKPLGDMSQDVCRIKQPDRWAFDSVCFRNNDTLIYAACYQNWRKGRVYRYRWNASKSQYVDEGCVIDGIRRVWARCLSVSSGGLLALGESGIHDGNFKVYSLE